MFFLARRGKMRIIFLSIAAALLLPVSAAAQMSASKDAQYLATIKAVSAYKINDEETLRDIERLRENKRFNNDLQKMLNKLQNTRTKNSDNKKVLQILENAGKQIYDILK